MKRSQLAINSVSTIRANLPDSLAAYHAAGFRNVEFPLHHVRGYLAEGHPLDEVRGLLERYDMRCIGGFDSIVECFSPLEQRERNHARIVQAAEFLAGLGGSTLVVGTDGPAEPLPDSVDEMAAAFASVAAAVEHTGVTLCIEFNWSPLVKTLRMAADIARRSGTVRVGVVFDPAHYYCTPTKFAELNAGNVALIKHVHVDDMRDLHPELSNCNSDRVLPGEGILDLPAILGQIEHHGYQGFFSIELFNEGLWALPAAEAARRMYQSLLPLCEDAPS
ncbi:MAG: sugar phosphate isomerase/epimerase [Anaerolineae bacterium]|nr:sugar phosphate isomerase/epimerase [Anaerolineae bacterium]